LQLFAIKEIGEKTGKVESYVLIDEAVRTLASRRIGTKANAKSSQRILPPLIGEAAFHL